MKRFVFAVPGDLATPTGGYAYDRRMIAELSDLGWQIDVARSRRRLSRGPSDSDARGRAGAAADGPAGRHHRRRRAGARRPAGGGAAACAPTIALVALVHHPLALESGLTAGQADALRASERAALAAAQTRHRHQRRHRTAARADYGVAPDKHHRRESGQRRGAGRARQSGRHRAPAVGRRHRAAQGL